MLYFLVSFSVFDLWAYYMLKKFKPPVQVQVQESVDKTAKQFFPPNVTLGVS